MRTKKILIVEDDSFSRGAMEKLLQSYNYEICSCALAEEAIARLEQESFNVLITDLHMPGMDGLELIKEARRIYPGISTVLVTGLGTDEIRLKAKEEGVNGFFFKPIAWDELLTLLDNLTGTGKVQSRDMSRNIRQEKRLFLPRRIFFALILFLFTVLNVQPLKAQQPFPKQNKPILKTDGQSTGWQSFFPGLTEEQAKAIENLQRTYGAEAFPVRMELMCLRLELRHLIRDPKVQARILFDHQRKISALQSKLEELSLSYQVKAKSVFTKEQWERLPQDWLLGMDTEYEPGMGVGRGPRREPKW